MADEEDICGPGKIRRVHGSADTKLSLPKFAGRLHKQFLHLGLPVGGVGAKVRKIGDETRVGLHPVMRNRIYTSVKRRDAFRAKLPRELGERLASRITEYQIERFQTVCRDVIDTSLLPKNIQRDRGIQVIKHAANFRKLQNEIGDRTCVRAIGGDDRHIAVGDCRTGRCFYVEPIGIKVQCVSLGFDQVSMGAIVRHIFFEKSYPMAACRERVAKASPKSGVPVPP